MSQYGYMFKPTDIRCKCGMCFLDQLGQMLICEKCGSYGMMPKNKDAIIINLLLNSPNYIISILKP